MDQESEVDLSNMTITPLWRKRRLASRLTKSASSVPSNLLGKARPAAYQNHSLQKADFAVDGVPLGGSSPGMALSRSLSGRVTSQRRSLSLSQSLPAPGEEAPVVLSTHSVVALRNGERQIIPRDLASGMRPRGESDARSRRALSMLEMPTSGPLVPRPQCPAIASPAQLRRGLRSTSYRRAVVSGVQFERIPSISDNNRTAQPTLTPVAEGRDRLSSPALGKEQKKRLCASQGAFEEEENAVLYQNFKEKALTLDNGDTDEDSERTARTERENAERPAVLEYRPISASWSQLSQVQESGILQTVSQQETKRQEAIFEVISSERSYMLSLDILIRMFKNSEELSVTMTKIERHHLFSNITDVSRSSCKFYTELEGRHQENVLIPDISDIVEKHSTSTFDPYVKYCSNEVYQQRTLQKLLDTNLSFREALAKIEAHPECRNLPMISFLILPMQRVTRLPLLMDTICQKTPIDSAEYECATRALKAVSKLVRQCNEGARRMERTEMMCTINSQLTFKIKPFPLVSFSRWLVKRGELTAFVQDNGIFSKRTTRQQVYFLLFNDVLIVTKKKSEDSYSVTDYALRDQLQVELCEAEQLNLSPMKSSPSMLYSRQSSATHLFSLTMLSNHAAERVLMLLGAESLSERARWFTALGQSSTDRQHPDRTTLTQVEITRTFPARQPDELSLQVADVVLLYQRVEDGWYEGERLRDGAIGWFPMEIAKEITCPATISSNIQRMGRLLGLETNV
ncbi:rho guanine nucleotide exchange factor 26 [Callorhinchus milii]|uniref:rho guanine nucleotide exchange factor 26 n=1 Tax=Callorhinchus milii TaxID=7868 RepID=UPI001C3F967F|nr:rho guanine nucleotide exchange factor 26 [Callorhinchus milii]XP_007888562.2 rho guanine nucleotide exchange factor 26 [Callorhinchus milii]